VGLNSGKAARNSGVYEKFAVAVSILSRRFEYILPKEKGVIPAEGIMFVYAN
jgi:hypothetical protein